MDTTQSNQTFDVIHQAYEQFSEVLKRQAEQIENLSQSVKLLQVGHQQLEEAASHLLAPLERSLASDGTANALSPSDMLASVCKLASANHAGQVFEVLAEESAHLGIRTVVFDVRGRAAWGAAASGFAPELAGSALRTLVVSLNQDGPFRQAFESAEAVEVRPADLEKPGHLLATLSPLSNARILLVPIRSADAVVAVLFAEAGEKRDLPLIDSLKVLAKFAGGQIDRMMVANGGFAAVEPAPAKEAVEATPAKEEAAKGSEEADRGEVQAQEPEPSAGPEIPVVATTAPSLAEFSGPPLFEEKPAIASPEIMEKGAELPTPAGAADAAHPTEEEEKVHRDARRFSKLLVSEIELYNKSGVEEGRRNRDLYQRLKKDIDRSRETYDKRFAHTVAKQSDYFHEELVKTLAENDPSLLGSGYPGPSV